MSATRSPVLATLALAALACALSGCPVQVEGAEPAARAAAPTAARASGSAGACDQASFALEPSQVVALVDGQPVTAQDLGDELSAEEDKALRTYCQQVADMRQMALDNHISERLLEAKAKAQGQTPDEYVRARVEAAMQAPPTDAEIQAFYDKHKSPQAPPLEMVKDRVVQAMQQDIGQNAVRSLIEELQASARIETRLPDIRPPALEVDIPSHTAAAGAADAVVTVVEFADFECPYCSRAADAMRAVKERFKGQKVRFAYRHFPLSFHPNARKAAEYAQCANAQGKFWAFHDRAYQNQDGLSEPELRDYATGVGVDLAALDECMTSGLAARQVEEDLARGRALGVEGTPTFYVNGRTVAGGANEQGLAEAIEAALRAGS